MDLSEYCCGHISYQLTGSIPGIEVKEKNNQLLFSGTLTMVTVGTQLTVKATDETGSTVRQTIYVYVGNNSTIVGKAGDSTILVEHELKEQEFASAMGGSKQYSYSAINLPAGIKLDENTGKISGKATVVGEYTVRLTITDKENENRTCQCTATLRVVDQKKVVGTVTDTSQKPLLTSLLFVKIWRTARYIRQKLTAMVRTPFTWERGHTT